MLAIIDTHPVQYKAPLYRYLHSRLGVRVTAIYGSDFSVAGYRDPGFGVKFSWDVDLLSGYDSVFLSRVAKGGAKDVDSVASTGMADALQRLRPAAVLLGGYSPRFHQAAFWHTWRGGWPILFRGEATDMQQDAGGLRASAKHAALSWMYGRCARLLYIGQSARRHYLSHGCPETKLGFSPYFVNTEPFRCEDPDSEMRREVRARLGISASRKVIVFSGKLSEYKRPDLLIAALKQMEGRENLAIVFLGDGAMRAQLEEAARQPPVVQAYFVGFQNQTQVSPYYHAADMLCLPSSWDTWGLVVNEALHHGLPCVVSDRVGCAPDLITPGITGEIFPYPSASELAAAITRLLPRTDNGLTALACRERVSHYTVQQAAEGITEALAL